MRYGLLLFILLFPLSGFADIYQSVDNNGVVHFSDTPSPGATVVNLAGASITEDKQIAVVKPDSGNNHLSVKAASHYYSRLTIVQPQNESTFFNNDGAVALTIVVEPAIRKEDSVVALVDGQLVKSVHHAALIHLKDIVRGAHTAQVQLQDKTGKVLAASNTITFFMRRPMMRIKGPLPPQG